MSLSHCASSYYTTHMAKKEPSNPFSATLSAMEKASPTELKAILKAINDQLPYPEPSRLSPQTKEQIRRDMTCWIMALEWEHGIQVPNPYKRQQQHTTYSMQHPEASHKVDDNDDWLKGRILKSVPFPVETREAGCKTPGRGQKRLQQGYQARTGHDFQSAKKPRSR